MEFSEFRVGRAVGCQSGGLEEGLGWKEAHEMVAACLYLYVVAMVATLALMVLAEGSCRGRITFGGKTREEHWKH